ncbi:MAG: hypothetical protein WCL50_01320 [Spirochaetota bacterium]
MTLSLWSLDLQGGPLSIEIAPTYMMPSPLDPNGAYYQPSAGTTLGLAFSPPFLPWASARVDLDYGYSAIAPSFTMSSLAGSGGLGVRVPAAQGVAVGAGAGAGLIFFWPNEIGMAEGLFLPVYSAFITADFAIGRTLGATTTVIYRLRDGSFSEVGMRVGLAWRPFSATAPLSPPMPSVPRPRPLSAAGGKGLVVAETAIPGIFPIFYAYYDDHPIGTIKVVNTEDRSLTDVAATVNIRQFMDAPKACPVIPEIAPGAEATIDLLALLKSGILDVTQATKVAAEIGISYTLDGKTATITRTETLRVFDRNAMTWDDDRKAAAFVSAKDPSVLVFSNNVNAFIKDRRSRALDAHLQVAMAIHDSLRLYGISYVSNPLTPYAVTSVDKTIVDTLKFPRQTLDYRSGDCSDLSILYAALLESLQVETAFITVPGHIFMAFALNASEAEARKSFPRVDELIFRDGKAWVPIEVTERKGGFIEAWQLGAKEWRENLSKGQAAFLPIHEAWKTYEPVGFPGQGAPPVVPPAAKVAEDFGAEVERFVQRQIAVKESELAAEIAKSGSAPKSVNALGTLYARYDLLDKAERQFLAAVSNSEYLPALVNLGNLYFLRADMERSLGAFQRASKVDPSSPLVLLGLARASHELEDYRTTRMAYDSLKKTDPALAAKYSYLDLKGEESTKAAEASGAKDMVEWSN